MPVKASERRIIYQGRKDRGECPRCGTKVDSPDSYTYCEACRAFFRGYHQENAESINGVRRTRYSQRRNKKRCPRCGAALHNRYRKTLCVNCLEKQYQYNAGKERPKKNNANNEKTEEE